MSSSLRTETLVSSIKAAGLKIDEIKSRDDLRQKLATIKTLAADGSKCDFAVLDVIKFNWKPLSPVNPRTVEPDLGYPEDFDTLRQWAFDRRFPELGTDAADHTAEKYLEYITSGQYKAIKKDWDEYATGVKSVNDTGALEPNLTLNSEFFVKKNNVTTPVPVVVWRKATARSREILGHYLLDKYIKIDFNAGRFKSWDDLEKKMMTYISFEDMEEEHLRTGPALKEIKAVVRGPGNPKVKFGSIRTILTPFLCTADNKDVENSVWGTGNETFRKNGPEQISPLLNELIKWLACWNVQEKEYDDAETEFFKDTQSLAPETLSEYRHKFIELLCKKARKSGGSKIAAVSSVEASELSGDLDHLESLEEDELDNFIEDFFSDGGTVGKILAIRERKRGKGGDFPKNRTNRFSRLKNFTGKFSNGTQGPSQRGGRGRGRGRGRGVARGAARGGKAPPGRNPTNSVCMPCTDANPPRFHSIAECPKGRNRVREVKAEDETGAEQAYRAVWEDYQNEQDI